MYRLARYALPLTVLAVAAGCSTSDLEDFSEISKLRTIAIHASEPGVGIGETVVFESVSVHPERIADVQYHWEVCVLSGGSDTFFACDEGALPLGQDASVAIPNVLASGTGRTFSFTQDLLAAEDVVDLCVAIATVADEISLPDFVELPSCKAGLPVTVRVEACLGELPPCADPEVSFMSYPLLLEEAAARTDRDENPAVGGLLVNGQTVRSDGSSVFIADEDRALVLTALVDESSAQHFEKIEGFNPSTEMLILGDEDVEEMRLSWFSTAGELGRSGFYSADNAPIEELQTNSLRFEEEELGIGTQVDLWFVLRDDRDGLSWREFSFTVQ